MRDFLRNKKIDFVGNLKKYLIILAAIILVGAIISVVFGVKLDINFKGGSRYTYSFNGDIDLATAQNVANKSIGSTSAVASISTDVTGQNKNLVISIPAGNTDNTASDTILKALKTQYPGSNFALADANTVGASIAGTFLLKSVVAILIAAILVIVYIGIRFRLIGGISAGVTALVALVVDIVVAFMACVIFRLEIDSNFIAVVLTILGYSLNDTVVIYDRIREEKKLRPGESVRNIVNSSINNTLGRTVATSVATLLAVLTVLVVSEFFGLNTLRSFAIPMSAGIISGAFSSICLSGPLWVLWCEKFPKKSKAKR